MQRDDVRLFSLDASKLAIAICDVSMRSPVKSVAAHFVSAIELIRQRVEIRALRQSLMKRGIKHRHLRKSRPKQLPRRDDAFYVCRIVQGCKLYARFDLAKHVAGDQHRLSESLASVHDPVTDRVDV